MVNITGFNLCLLYRFPEMMPHMSGRKGSNGTFPFRTRHKGCLDGGQTALVHTPQVHLLSASGCLGSKAPKQKEDFLSRPCNRANKQCTNPEPESQEKMMVLRKHGFFRGKMNVCNRGSGKKTDIQIPKHSGLS